MPFILLPEEAKIVSKMQLKAFLQKQSPTIPAGLIDVKESAL